MSGHTAACRSRYSAMRSGLTCSWKHTRCTSRLPGGSLEVELRHVRLVEDERRPEDHLRPLVRPEDDLVGAELARLERLADLAGDLLVGDRRDGVAGQVPEVLRVPEGELLDRAVHDVLLHLARQAEAGQGDLVLV